MSLLARPFPAALTSVALAALTFASATPAQADQFFEAADGATIDCVLARGALKRLCSRMEFSTRSAVVEYAPRRTTLIERVEDDVALGLIEGLDKSAGEVENYRALSPLPDL